MRKQKRLKKINIPNFTEALRAAFFKKVMVIFLTALFLILMLFLAKSFLRTSRYFKLKDIEVSTFAQRALSDSLKNELLKSYKNRNVFKINLKAIQKSVVESYSDVKDVSVKIALPDKISVVPEFRKPVALVSEIRLYPIDEDGIAVSGAEASSLKDLPVIHGVSVNRTWHLTQKTENKNLKCALELMCEIKKCRLPPAYHLTAIDAADIKNISFSLNDLFEVRIGCENLKERLNLLKKTLRNPRLLVDRIKYIDVRFEEAVIGPR